MFNEKGIVKSIWLGAKRDPETTEFHWNNVNQSNITYSNWRQINNDNELNCVEMISFGPHKNKWTNT